MPQEDDGDCRRHRQPTRPIDDEPVAIRDTLPIARRSRSATRLTIGLIVVFGISAGLLVGVLIGKDHGKFIGERRRGGVVCRTRPAIRRGIPGRRGRSGRGHWKPSRDRGWDQLLLVPPARSN